MRFIKQTLAGVIFFGIMISACTRGDKEKGGESNVKLVKGLYTFGPEMRSFTLCEDGREYWVTDSVKNLELQYNNLDFEKPYEPVYVELEGFFTKADTAIVSQDFDSTLVVTKVIRISKEIPEGPCAQ